MWLEGYLIIKFRVLCLKFNYLIMDEYSFKNASTYIYIYIYICNSIFKNCCDRLFIAAFFRTITLDFE